MMFVSDRRTAVKLTSVSKRNIHSAAMASNEPAGATNEES